MNTRTHNTKPAATTRRRSANDIPPMLAPHSCSHTATLAFATDIDGWWRVHCLACGHSGRWHTTIRGAVASFWTIDRDNMRWSFLEATGQSLRRRNITEFAHFCRSARRSPSMAEVEAHIETIRQARRQRRDSQGRFVRLERRVAA